MNEQLKTLAVQAGAYFAPPYTDHFGEIYPAYTEIRDLDIEKFASSIVAAHINLLQQEWYDLNNAPEVENESPRDIGIRVGKKSEVISLMNKIKTHFGVTE